MTNVAANPYAWPYGGDVTAVRIALVVAGAHRLWRDRSHDVDVTVAVLDRVATAVRSSGGTVVALRHRARAVGRRPSVLTEGCGPDGTLFVDYLGTPTEVVDAGGLNGFHASRLDELLRLGGYDHLVFGGFGAELTVDTTLRAANDRGYECLVLGDACARLDRDTGTRALDSVTKSGGIFGAVATSADFLAALGASPSRAVPATAPPTTPSPLERNIA